MEIIIEMLITMFQKLRSDRSAVKMFESAMYVHR